MSYSEVLRRALDRGDNLADVALGSMMDIVEEETGSYPKWSDKAPEWILENFGIQEA